MVTTAPQSKSNPIPSVLIVGNYCHDVLLQGCAVVAKTLGGAASFISNVFSGLSVSFDLTSKVGLDFKYPHPYNPIVVPASKTTVFHAYFDLGDSENAHQDRVLKRVEACDPIYPSDLPDKRFDFGMAVGVGGEILPETLEKMVEICDAVFVDIQALIRVFETNGTVKLVGLKESGVYHLLPRLKFIKASSEEALFMDVEEVRQWCCVVVTRGKDGCQVYWKDGEIKAGPFGANQIDPTGAGDSFLGGFVGGLVHGLVVPDAALLGNFFGSLTVAQIGLPRFDLRLLQRVKDEVQRRKLHCTGRFQRRDDQLSFTKPLGHEEFHASLASTKLVSTFSIQECQRDLPRSSRTVDQVIRPQYNGQPQLLLSSLFDDPI
ncbi:inositol 3-kinase-like [Durio zibethinus]|uniref:Inositol 3-kinase-like n=1 Tax=Durio zibethinus TaxID=66656 RepID=A0A6P5ZN39_DURZI|nr:inositol 3-kinase-like [Durio zibethinus]